MLCMFPHPALDRYVCVCLLTSTVSVNLVAFSVFIYPVHPRCKNMPLSQFYTTWSHKSADRVTEILGGIGNFCLLIHARCCCFSASPLEWINFSAPGEEKIKEPIIREETLSFWEKAESSSSPKWVLNGLFFFILQMKPNPFCSFRISSITGGGEQELRWDCKWKEGGARHGANTGLNKIMTIRRLCRGSFSPACWRTSTWRFRLSPEPSPQIPLQSCLRNVSERFWFNSELYSPA